MTRTANMIMHSGGQNLPFARDLREALATYARRTWPLNTSGHAARTWGISKSTAANLLKGSASDATISQILRRGGWSLGSAVIAAVIGQPLEHFITEQAEAARRERDEWDAQQARLDRMAEDLRRRGPEPSGVAG